MLWEMDHGHLAAVVNLGVMDPSWHVSNHHADII